MDYSPEQLNSLIAEVEKEFKVHLAKAEDSFKSAKEDEPKKEESKEGEEKKEAPKAEGSPMESEKPADEGTKDQNQQADNEAGKDDQKEPGEGEAPKAAESPAEEGHGYDDEDMGHMESMYGSMSKPELKAHHDCIRKCMDSMGLAKCEEGMAKAEMEDGAKDAEGYRPNGGPTDGEAKSEGKGPASSDTQALNKSEKNVAIDEVALLKSELAAEKAKGDDRQKNLEAVQAFLTKFVEKTVPAGKAITSLDIIAKHEGANKEKPLSKSEIDAKLTAKAKEVTLTKSDRDAINSYYCGSKDITKVSHLLK